MYESAIQEPKRIILIRRNRLGDMICTLPLVHELKKKFPNARIRIVSDAAGCEVASWASVVDEVYQVRPIWPKFLMPWRNKNGVRNADVVIAVKGGFDRSLAKLVRNSHAPVRIGFDAQNNSDFYSHSISPPPYEHQIKSIFRLLKPLEINEPASYCFDLCFPSVTETICKWHQAPEQKKLLLSLTCNRGLYWPLEKYWALADHLSKKKNVCIGIMKRPEEELSPETLQACQSRKISIFSPENLSVVASLLKQSDGYISPEGGLVHLAASTRTPTLVLWRPDGVIQKWGSTAPTHRDLQPAEGIENFTVDQMIETIRQHFHWDV